MEARNIKNEVVEIMQNHGLQVEQIGRDKYLINNNVIVLLRYSQIYYDKNITWFGIRESLFYENEVDFLLLIIHDSDNVLVTPFELLQSIPNFVNLASSNSTYEIHIDPVNYIINETDLNLILYLNSYGQLSL